MVISELHARQEFWSSRGPYFVHVRALCQVDNAYYVSEVVVNLLQSNPCTMQEMYRFFSLVPRTQQHDLENLLKHDIKKTERNRAPYLKKWVAM